MGSSSSNGGAATEAPARTKTAYVVLHLVHAAVVTEDGSELASTPTLVWAPLTDAKTGEVKAFEGNNDTDAIKAAITAAKLEQGSFVAVPARSFRTRIVSVQTRTTVSISDS